MRPCGVCDCVTTSFDKKLTSYPPCPPARGVDGLCDVCLAGPCWQLSLELHEQRDVVHWAQRHPQAHVLSSTGLQAGRHGTAFRTLMHAGLFWCIGKGVTPDCACACQASGWHTAAVAWTQVPYKAHSQELWLLAAGCGVNSMPP